MESSQSFQVFQTGVADFVRSEAQRHEVSQSFEMFLEMFQLGVTDLLTAKRNPCHMRKPFALGRVAGRILRTLVKY